MEIDKLLVLGITLLVFIGTFTSTVANIQGSDEDFVTFLDDESLFGEGTPEDPYMIYDVYDLQNISLDLGAHYALANDIDASDTNDWNEGAGFEPMGIRTDSFTGTLDGRNYTITGLYINRSTTDYVGMFGYIGGGAMVKNIGLIDNIIIGNMRVGAFAGETQGIVFNSFSIGNVTGIYSDVGGLVGRNLGTIENSYVIGNTTGINNLGGLVGNNDFGEVENSYAKVDVNGEDRVGGLIGRHLGEVENSFAGGNVTGNEYVGGLIGENRGTVIDSYSVGNATGNVYVGGLIGDNFGNVQNSHYNIESMLINGQHYVTLGGLFQDQYDDWIDDKYLDISDYTDTLVPGDYNELLISDIDGMKHLLGFSHVSEYTFRLSDDIDISTEPGLYIPSLKADFDGQGYGIYGLHIDMDINRNLGMFGYVEEETKVSNIGVHDIDVTGRINVGGLAGMSYGNISYSHVSGNVSGGHSVGGLVGYNYGMAYESSASINVTGTWIDPYSSHYYYGGLVGLNRGTVSKSFANGNISGYYYTGGLVGYNWEGIIEYSYSTGTVDGNLYSGGFIGRNRGMITHSYSTGDLTISEYGGGFVGINEGDVFYCNSTGNVSGTMTLGGFVGENSQKIESSYSRGHITSIHTTQLGGLVGRNYYGTVVNSHYNIEEVEINGENYVTLGGLYNGQFYDWLDERELDISDYSGTLIPSGDSYGIDSYQGMKDLLGFAAYGEYSFHLMNDIDLSTEPGLYIPYLAGDFDGHDRTISNLYVDIGFTNNIGMFGYIDEAYVANLRVIDANINGWLYVGGITGYNDHGIISNSGVTGVIHGRRNIGGLIGINSGSCHMSYADSSVDGRYHVGGLIGRDFEGTISNCYANGSVLGNQYLGGLIGSSEYGTVINSYSTTNVDAGTNIGGLIGYINGGSVQNSFWDNETSGLEYSDGGIGLNTTEMMKIITYLEASWDIVGVDDPSQGSMDHIWNIVDNETYPFFGWKNSIKIYTWADLYNMRNDLEADYILMNDLTPESPGYEDYASESADGGKGWNPVGNASGISPQFRGSFDGNGYTISGLYIDRSDEDYMGLFGYVVDATVKNVGLSDVNITGRERVGALMGWNLRGNISDSYASGEVTGSFYVGGLVGYHDDGIIHNSSAAVDVNGGFTLGGLVGDNQGTVENSYATGAVSGDTEIGGLLGYHFGTVTNSYSTGAVSGDDVVGGFMGNYDSGKINDCFYDYQTSGASEGAGSPSPTDPEGIERKTTEEMQTMSTFTDAGWDFDEVWWMIEDETYPLHRWGSVYNMDSRRSFNNIQCAIDAPTTLEGDTIVVSPGTFKESVWIDKSIDLIGSGMDETYLDAQGEDFGMLIMANHTTVRGITVMNATGGDPGAGLALLNPIWDENDDGGGPPPTHPLIGVTIEYVRSTDNNNGIIMLDTHESTIVNNELVNSVYENIILMCSHENLIADNKCNDGDQGITLMESNNNEIYGNEASYNEFGIFLIMSEQNIIHNNTANENSASDDFSGMGIVLAEDSQYNDLIDNELSDNMFGISVIDSTNNTLSGNQMVNNGIVIMGGEVEHWNTHEIDETNTVNGLLVRYLKDQIGGSVESPAGQVILANCTDVTVDGLEISSATGGILMGFSWENQISNNELHGNVAGMALFNSTDNEIYGNEVYENQVGIVLESASHGNIIRDNRIYDHDEGIQIHSGDGNLIYHNVFTNNNDHAYDSGDNSWDKGYPSGGNYWDDHTGQDDFSGEAQKVPGSDGMIEEPRYIDGGESVDNYPWTNPQFVLLITLSEETPQDGASSVPLDTTLSVYVEADGHPTEVEFYFEGILVYSETIASDGVVETGAMEDLDYYSEYDWYVVATNDGGNNYTRSQDYVFTTLDQFILTLNIQGEGTVEVDGEELSSGSWRWKDKGIANLKAIPNTGWEFVEWTGDTQNIADVWAAETTINMKDDYSITAKFQLIEYELIIDSTDGGSVTYPGEGTFNYVHGTSINLEAQPDQHYVFVEWTGDTDTINDVTQAQTTLTIEGDYEISAVFELEYEFYELIVEIKGEGEVSISPNPDSTMDKYQEGTYVYLTANPDDGWVFSHWEGDVLEGDEEYYSISIVMDSDKSLTAHFVEEEELVVETYQLTLNVVGEGFVDIIPHQVEYESGSMIDLTAIPDEGWLFAEWTGDVEAITDNISSGVSLEMYDDITLTAHFIEDDTDTDDPGDSDEPDDPDDIDDTDDSAEDGVTRNILSSYWWMILVAVIAVVALLIFLMRRGKTPSTLGEEPMDENEEISETEVTNGEELDETEDKFGSSSNEDI